MKMIIIGLTLITAMGAASAQDVVLSETVEMSVKATKNLSVKMIETTEACVFTFDPRWADDEDTTSAQTIFENYKETMAKLDQLKKDGFQFLGYENKEVCDVNHSTFKVVMSESNSRYFPVFTKGSVLAAAACEQKAFKTVKRIYVAGLEELKGDLVESLKIQTKKLVNRYQ